MATLSLLLILLLIRNNNGLQKPVSYQVHSWNDMSLWPNGFKQGMSHMKIDANFMVKQSFCDNQNQVTSNTTNGCFLLSHDSLTSSRQYNSTDDVLLFIKNNINLFNSTSIPIFMAICFKLNDASPCDNSDTAIKWRALVTTLMNSLLSLINNYNLTLQIILDGVASDDNINSNQCIAHLWEPFIKTFTVNP